MFRHCLVSAALALLLPLAASATIIELPIQHDIDRAYALILSTTIGKAVCRDILGADPQALEFHFGISTMSAAAIANECKGAHRTPAWVFPTRGDISKLSIENKQHRRYRVFQTDQTFPIESWTDPFTNTTTIFTTTPEISFTRLVQVLAHEMAVYFDSKINPMHAGARQIPALANLHLSNTTQMNALVAISNPLVAHTMTYLRALQVEFAVLDELVPTKIRAPADFYDSYLRYLISDQCNHNCILGLIRSQRSTYLPIALPLLAFAPHYRALISAEMQHLQSLWSPRQWQSAQLSLNQFPEQFWKQKFTGDVMADLATVYYAGEADRRSFQIVTSFLNDDLWPLEDPALNQCRLLDQPKTLLEFMREPLLSGYNILLASGPRARIRGGNTE